MEHVSELGRNRALTVMRRGSRSASWLTHSVLLTLVIGYIGLSALQGTPDANIGSGLGLLALGALGAPWTLPLLMSNEVTLDSGLFVAAAMGGAALNLALHAAAVGQWRGRSRRAQGE